MGGKPGTSANVFTTFPSGPRENENLAAEGSLSPQFDGETDTTGVVNSFQVSLHFHHAAGGLEIEGARLGLFPPLRPQKFPSQRLASQPDSNRPCARCVTRRAESCSYSILTSERRSR